MSITAEKAVELARQYLCEIYEGAAVPLYEVDDYGEPIYEDPGCVDWGVCDLFELEKSFQLEVEGVSIIVTLEALVHWSHWGDVGERRGFFISVDEDSDVTELGYWVIGRQTL
jgi:EAL domain-containing protein (putative c-di-GMP-specific phosphodiesterase class I)